MDSAQIEQYLGFLGQKLADMQVTTSLILLGGALMITQIGNRKATQDIDVVIATNDRRTYQAVQQAIILVAQEKKLPPAWLNDDVTIVVDQIGKPVRHEVWIGGHMQAERGDVVARVRDHGELVGAEQVHHAAGESRAAGAAGEKNDHR